MARPLRSVAGGLCASLVLSSWGQAAVVRSPAALVEPPAAPLAPGLTPAAGLLPEVTLSNDPSAPLTLAVTLPASAALPSAAASAGLPVAAGLSAVLPAALAIEPAPAARAGDPDAGEAPTDQTPTVRGELDRAGRDAAGAQEDLARGEGPGPGHDGAKVFDGNGPGKGGGKTLVDLRREQRQGDIESAARSVFPEGPLARVELNREAPSLDGIPLELVRESGAGHLGLYRFELDGRYLLLKVFKDEGAAPTGELSGEALKRLRGALIGAQLESGRRVRGAGRLSSGEPYVILDEAFPGQRAKALHEAQGAALERFLAEDAEGARATARMAQMLLEVFSYGVVPHDADFLVRSDGEVRWLGAETWTMADPHALSGVTASAMGAAVARTLARLAPDPAAGRAFLADFLVALKNDGRLTENFKRELLEAAFGGPVGLDAVLETARVRVRGEALGGLALVRSLYDGIPESPQVREVTPRLDALIAGRYRAEAARRPLRRWLRRIAGFAGLFAGAALMRHGLAGYGITEAAVPWLIAGFNISAFSVFLTEAGLDLWRLAALPLRLAAWTARGLYGLLPSWTRAALRWLTIPVWGPPVLLWRLFRGGAALLARGAWALAPKPAPGTRLTESAPQISRRGFLRWTALAGVSAAGSAALLNAPALYETGRDFLAESRLDEEILEALARGPQELMALQFDDGSWGITQPGREYHRTWNSIHDRAAVTAKVLAMLMDIRPKGWEGSFRRGYEFLLSSMMLGRNDLRAANQPVSWNNEQPYMLALSLNLFLDMLERPARFESEAETRAHVVSVLDKIRRSTWVYGEGVYRRGSFQMAILGETLLRAHDKGFAMPSRFAPISDFAPDSQSVASMVGMPFSSLGAWPANLIGVMEAQRRRQPQPDILTDILDGLQATRDPATGLFAYSVGGRTNDEYGAAARTVQIDYLLYSAERHARYRGTGEREVRFPDGRRLVTRERATLDELRRSRDRFLRFQPRMHDHVRTSPWVTHDPDNSNVAKYYYQLGLQYVIMTLLLTRDDPGTAEAAGRLTASILDDQERDEEGKPNGTVVYSREAVGVPYTTAALLPLLRELMPLRPSWPARRIFVEREAARILRKPFLPSRPDPDEPVPLDYPTWWLLAGGGH